MTTVKINLDPLIARKVIVEGRPITLREISLKTGITENRLVDYRKNRASAVKLETIAALCDYFNCTPGDLLVLERAAPGQTEKAHRLAQLVSQITPENRHPETFTGQPVGNEVW